MKSLYFRVYDIGIVVFVVNVMNFGYIGIICDVRENDMFEVDREDLSKVILFGSFKGVSGVVDGSLGIGVGVGFVG